MFADLAGMTARLQQAGLAALAIAFAGAAMMLLPTYPATVAIWSALAVTR